MSEEEVEKLLGRPLSEREQANFDLYLNIAKESLEELLCISLDVQADESDSSDPETRTFDIREGYSTVFTDIFNEVNTIEVDGNEITDFYPAFWDKKNNAFYNSIVLDKAKGKELQISAFWGFVELPDDLKQLWAQLFADTSQKYVSGSGNIKSKQVEDFRISYGDLTNDQSFINANSRIISKYGMCDIGYIKHGKVCRHGSNCLRCIR